MELKSYHAKVVTLLDLRNCITAKVILRGSTKKFLRHNIPGKDEMLQILKDDYDVFPESDFEQVREVSANYLNAKRAFMSLSATAI